MFFTEVIAAVMALVSAAAAAAVPNTVAWWDMNETPVAATMVDSSGQNLYGDVGADVRTGVFDAGATVYRFPDVAPNDPPTRPGHLVTVPHSTRLNPDSGDFTVTVRFRTTQRPSNIVQKGQAETPGGYWKVEQDGELARCVFVGGDGQGRSAGARVRVDDGKWHTVTCERTATSVAVSVDGVRRGSASGSSGAISNASSLAIGGKSDCDQQRVGCDYFSGDIDYVRIQKG